MPLFQDLSDKYEGFGKLNTQMPVVASFSNALGNLKPGFMLGFGKGANTAENGGGFRGTVFNRSKKELYDSAGEVIGSRKAWNPQFSIGGTLTAGYGAVGGAAIGAGIGAIAGRFSEAGSVSPLAIAGAATVGAAGLMAAPVVAGAAARGALSVLQNTDKIFAGIGSAVGGALGTAGKGIKTAIQGADLLTTAAASTSNTLATALNPFAAIPQAALGFASSLVKFDEKAYGLGKSFAKVGSKDIALPGVKLSGLGKALVVGGTMFSGAKEAANSYMSAHEGTRDNYVTRPTPSIQLMDNAGASGDLVFAMNNNRRG